MAIFHALGVRARLLAMTALCGLTASNVSAQSTVNYTYDDLGRVTSAVTSPSGKKVLYTYDAAGNRTQVGNGVTYAEIFPTAFSASSTKAGATGLTTSAMKDAAFNTRSSIHVSDPQSISWIQADLGTAKNVDHIDIAAALDSPWAIGPWNLNTAHIEYSTNGTTWTKVATVSGVVASSYATIKLGGVSGRYFRVKRPTYGQIAMGDFRFYTSDDTSNEQPTAAADSAIANGGASVLVDVLANDSDPENDPIVISAYTQPAHGSTTAIGQAISYTPASGYVGSDTFTYSITDHVATSIGTVTMTVNAAANAPPVANDDGITTPAYMRTSFNPRTNDSDPNGDALTITGVGSPSHGAATIKNGTSIEYVPVSGYVGYDHFIYTISDGKGGTASATVVMTMTSGNPAMLAVMQPETYAPQVTIVGDTFNIPSNQSVNVYVNEPITSGKKYWEIQHQCGFMFAGLANDIATARNGGGYSNYNAGIYTYQGAGWPSSTPYGATAGQSVANDVYGFAYSAGSQELKIYRNNVYKFSVFASGNGAQYPHASMQAGYQISGQTCSDTSVQAKFKFGAGSTTYAPPAGYSHLSDHSSSELVPPVALNDVVGTPTNVAKTFDPRLNDTDANGDALTITAVSTPSHGVAAINSGASVTYTPTAGYTGSDSFTYTISDGHGGSAIGTVNVTIATSMAYQPSFRVMKTGLTGASIGSTIFNIPASSGKTALMSTPPHINFAFEIDVTDIAAYSGFIGVASQAWFDGGGQYAGSIPGTAHWYIGMNYSYGESSGSSATWTNSSQALSFGDVLGMSYSSSTRKLRIYRNGGLIGTITANASLAGVTMYPMIGSWVGTVAGSFRSSPSSYMPSYAFD